MATLLERFEGEDGRQAVVEALRKQALILGDVALAKRFLEVGALSYVASGETLITQGAWDTDLFFILAGEFEIWINGQSVDARKAGEHVGELAGLSGSRPRTATVIARTESLVLKVSDASLRATALNNASFWRAAADTIAMRLDERNSRFGTANDHPNVFVISSSEALGVAEIVRRELNSGTLTVRVWHKGTFSLSEYPISDLEDAIELSDFTIAIARPDDTIIFRGESSRATRDNVHLEYGIALGKLGRKRSILLVDVDPSLRLPSDLAGLTTARYRGRDASELQETVATACDEIRNHISMLGVRRDRRNI